MLAVCSRRRWKKSKIHQGHQWSLVVLNNTMSGTLGTAPAAVPYTSTLLIGSGAFRNALKGYGNFYKGDPTMLDTDL